MSILYPETQSALDAILKGSRAVLEVTVPHCATCAAFGGILDKVADEFEPKGVRFVQANAASPAFGFLQETRSITASPTVLLCIDGVEVMRFCGPVAPKVLRQSIQVHLVPAEGHGGAQG